MKGWRSKLVFLFIIYLAGFATAVYMLAPAPEKEITSDVEQSAISSAISNFDSQEFVNSFNTGIHKCIDLGKEAALRTAKYIREKAQEKQLNQTES